jgi:hypothetical protein
LPILESGLERYGIIAQKYPMGFFNPESPRFVGFSTIFLIAISILGILNFRKIRKIKETTLFFLSFILLGTVIYLLQLSPFFNLQSVRWSIYVFLFIVIGLSKFFEDLLTNKKIMYVSFFIIFILAFSDSWTAKDLYETKITSPSYEQSKIVDRVLNNTDEMVGIYYSPLPWLNTKSNYFLTNGGFDEGAYHYKWVRKFFNDVLLSNDPKLIEQWMKAFGIKFLIIDRNSVKRFPKIDEIEELYGDDKITAIQFKRSNPRIQIYNETDISKFYGKYDFTLVDILSKETEGLDDYEILENEINIRLDNPIEGKVLLLRVSYHESWILHCDGIKMNVQNVGPFIVVPANCRSIYLEYSGKTFATEFGSLLSLFSIALLFIYPKLKKTY